jgi:hypothetical protein
MRGLPDLRKTNTAWVAAAAVVVLVASHAALSWVASPASGQQRSVLAADLDEALVRAAPGERVQVLIEMSRENPLPPLSLDREIRAAEHASNLAGLYASSLDRLQRELPTSLALDLQARRVLWVGGAVAAELTPEQVRSLDGQPGVRRVHYDGLVQVDLAAGPAAPTLLVWAPGLPPAQDAWGEVPWGLEVIGAPTLWQAGATGEGVVVATLDSGVDGDHPLLRRKWRGLSTSPALGWFDPWGLTEFPNDDDGLAGVGHGTTVMTVVLGSLEVGDTLIESGQPRVVEDEFDVVTGVAPGAEWVAVNGFEGFGGATYTRLSVLMQGMQWVLDPDGDPATVTDVPDILSNSWGFRSDGCDGVFDRAIDALELAGVPVVFASGNRSAGLDTVAAPADRADLLLNAFAVGAVELRDGEIRVSPNSLGGPPPCAPGSVKPEVVAPGVTPIVRGLGPRTAELRGTSGTFTSWAAPHVSGALAVLKGLNPRAGANELKDALFSTAEDLPPTGLDNRSGAGLIDLVAAAGAVGGLGGVQLVVDHVEWDSAGLGLRLGLFNRGDRSFPGGSARLLRAPARDTLASANVAPIPSGQRGGVVFEKLPATSRDAERFTLLLESDGTWLGLPVALRVADESMVTLADGEVRFSLDAYGRLGRVTRGAGFVFQGSDWLTGGALLFATAGGVSDAAYVDVLKQPALKSNPVGSDTDWHRTSLSDAGASAEVAFADDKALYPLGVSVRQDVELVSLGDTAAFVSLAVSVQYGAGVGTPLVGLLLDWDFAGGDFVGWDDLLGASVMVPADSSGPWMAVSTTPVAPTTHAPVPLGEPGGLRYQDGSGVLARTEGFTDEDKARFMALGGEPTSDGSASDWAQLVSVGPIGNGAEVIFVVAAGRDREELQLALDSARAFALEKHAPGPVASGRGALQLLPPYPNPFNPAEGEAVSLPFLVDRTLEPAEAVLEIYTIAGRHVYTEQRTLVPERPVEPFSWTGLLGNGDAAATGVYGYVIRIGGRRETGKFVLLK